MYEGKLVRLCALNVSDAERCARWMNDMEIARQTRGAASMPYTIEQEREWIVNHAGVNNRGENHFRVETLDGRHIGVCSYNSVNRYNRTCMLGWYIGDAESRGKGYGTDMIKLLLSICFDELDMHKVKLNVFGYNEGAIRLYERLGFVRDAAYREEIYSRGRRWDEYGYSMLRAEYEKLYK